MCVYASVCTASTCRASLCRASAQSYGCRCIEQTLFFFCLLIKPAVCVRVCVCLQQPKWCVQYWRNQLHSRSGEEEEPPAKWVSVNGQHNTAEKVQDARAKTKWHELASSAPGLTQQHVLLGHKNRDTQTWHAMQCEKVTDATEVIWGLIAVAGGSLQLQRGHCSCKSTPSLAATPMLAEQVMDKGRFDIENTKASHCCMPLLKAHAGILVSLMLQH